MLTKRQTNLMALMLTVALMSSGCIQMAGSGKSSRSSSRSNQPIVHIPNATNIPGLNGTSSAANGFDGAFSGGTTSGGTGINVFSPPPVVPESEDNAFDPARPSAPPLEYDIPDFSNPDVVGDAIGYTSVRVRVHARKILRVQYMPEPNSRTVEGTGYTPPYSQFGVYLEVNGRSRPTPLLPVGVKSPILDFSSAFTKYCPASNTSCRETVDIIIKQPNYDYWCLNYGYCWYTHNHVYDTHPWQGVLYVETDDTQPLE